VTGSAKSGIGTAAGRVRGGPPNKAASSRFSSQSSPSGHLTPALRLARSAAAPGHFKSQSQNLFGVAHGQSLGWQRAAPLVLWKLIRRSRAWFRIGLKLFGFIPESVSAEGAGWAERLAAVTRWL